MKPTCLIYALRDPRTKRVRYVGKSSKGIKRARRHLCPAIRIRPYHIYNWIRKLLSLGLKPTISVLEILPYNSTDDRLSQRERHWIRKLRAQGAKLTNSTTGGEGTRGFKHSLKSRRRMSAAKKGKPLSAEHRRHLQEAKVGWVISKETRIKISLAKRGVPKPPHIRRFLRDHNPMARRVRCVNDGKEYPTLKAASKAYGVAATNIGRVCKGRYYAPTIRGLSFLFV